MLSFAMQRCRYIPGVVVVGTGVVVVGSGTMDLFGAGVVEVVGCGVVLVVGSGVVDVVGAGVVEVVGCGVVLVVGSGVVVVVGGGGGNGSPWQVQTPCTVQYISGQHGSSHTYLQSALYGVKMQSNDMHPLFVSLHNSQQKVHFNVATGSKTTARIRRLFIMQPRAGMAQFHIPTCTLQGWSEVFP